MRWNFIYNPKLNSDLTLFYTRYRYNTIIKYKVDAAKQSDIYNTAVHDFGIKADYNWYASDIYKLRFGGGISHNWFNPGQMSYKDNLNEQRTGTVIGKQNQVQALNYHVYAENEINLHRLSFNIGGRMSAFQVNSKNYFSIEPRLIASLNFGKFGAVKVGYTKMMQPVHMLSYSSSAFPTDIWLPSTPGIAPGTAVQYSIGYFKSFRENKYEFSAELYNKRMNNLIAIKGGVPLINTNTWEQNVETKGTGYSKGVEMMLQKKAGKNTGWISYTLAKSNQKFDNLNNGNSYPFKYDRRHDFSFVFNREIRKNVDFSATWIYGSGYPTTLHNGIYQTVSIKHWYQVSPETSIFENAGEAYLYPGKNWLRMRDYHRLDLGVNFKKEIKIKNKLRERTWTFGLYNAYNRQNAVFYYITDFGQPDTPMKLYQQSGFPIIPSVKYSVKF